MREEITMAEFYKNWNSSVPEKLGLAPDLHIVLYKDSIGGRNGCLPYDTWYKVIETGDLIVVTTLGGLHAWEKKVKIEKGFFNRRKDYAKRVGEYSRLYGIPFEVCLVLGDNSDIYELINKRFKELSENKLKGNILHELKECGINRRNAASKLILGDEVYSIIEKAHPRGIGQKHSMRLASWLADCYEKKFKR